MTIVRRLPVFSVAALVLSCATAKPMTDPQLDTKNMPPPNGAETLSGSVEAFKAACEADLEKARRKTGEGKTS